MRPRQCGQVKRKSRTQEADCPPGRRWVEELALVRLRSAAWPAVDEGHWLAIWPPALRDIRAHRRSETLRRSFLTEQDLVTVPLVRATEGLLRCPIGVHVGSVEQVDAADLADCPWSAAPEGHRSERQRRHRKPATAQESHLH